MRSTIRAIRATTAGSTPLPPPNPVPEPVPQRALPRWWRWALVGGVAAALITGMVAVFWQPDAGGTLVGGVRLTDAELAFYRDHQRWLGEVVGRGEVAGQSSLFFTYAAVTPNPHATVRGSREAWELLDLGRQEALRRRMTLRPGAAPHPVVAAYLDELVRQGVPWRYWLGSHAVTDELCLTGADAASPVECVQFYPFAALRFAPGGTSVVRDPLGAQYPRP